MKNGISSFFIYWSEGFLACAFCINIAVGLPFLCLVSGIVACFVPSLRGDRDALLSIGIGFQIIIPAIIAIPIALGEWAKYGSFEIDGFEDFLNKLFEHNS